MFGGRPYTYYNKPFNPICIDSTESSHAHARNHLVSSIYNNRFDDGQIASHQHEYKVIRSAFLRKKCSSEGENSSDGLLSLRRNAKIEQDLTLEYEGVDITQKGKGAQCEIKAAYALRNRSGDKDNLVLLEEPENHLSHSRTRVFVDKIKNSDSAQVILTSHSSLICLSLGLSECIFLSNTTLSNNKLSELNSDTSDFFTKAPNHNILELILSEKVILVEGHAEYLLCQHLFYQEYGEDMHAKGVHLISVNGLSFKRYLEVGKLLGRKVAVITDNDESKDSLISKYSEFSDVSSVEVFYDDDETRYTFEVCVYKDNQSICDEVFTSKKDGALDWMLKNKSEAAFQLYKSGQGLTSPKYIKESFAWILS
ncbi:MAG: AAA family ATPase [Gammaproteobacteria bacterium]|nr:AAA family ATPase [Gammaproteobacteria bacterium]